MTWLLSHFSEADIAAPRPFAMTAAGIGATAAAAPVMLVPMKRPSTPSMFSQETKRIVRRKAKGGPRASIGRVALGAADPTRPGRELVGFESNIAGALKWAKAILRKAGLPADLRERVRKDGTKTMALLDDDLIEKGTLEWQASRVVYFSISAINNVKVGNAEGAAYCANLATEHYFRGWFEEMVAPFLPTGIKGKRAARKRGDEILKGGITADTLARLGELLAEQPLLSELGYCKIIACEEGVSSDVVRKRLQRHRKRRAGT